MEISSLYFRHGQLKTNTVIKLFTSFVETTVDSKIYAFNTHQPYPATTPYK